MILNLNALKRHTKVKYGFVDFILKPVILAAVTAVAALFTYSVISPYTHIVIALGAAIAVTAVVYVVALLIVKGLSEEEIILLPKGEVILRKLKKFKII